tara:strand:+ start:38 stop:442 length:405 start_codon:yes stop_codon:yes gene_type:complete
MNILIVDDSTSCRIRLCKIFEETNQDFSILQANNGNEALSILDKNKNLDIIFCDVNMPEMDGLTLLKILRENNEHACIPFVIYSTECSEELKKIAKEFKASAWLLKPAKSNTILMALERILQPIFGLKKIKSSF